MRKPTLLLLVLFLLSQVARWHQVERLFQSNCSIIKRLVLFLYTKQNLIGAEAWQISSQLSKSIASLANNKPRKV